MNLDQAATAPMDPGALHIFAETALNYPGNPSSVHPEGRRAAEKLKSCRAELSALLGGDSGSLVFTSGATEANNMIITAVTRKSSVPGEIILSAIEHPSVWEPVHQVAADGWTIRVLPVDELGRIRTDRLKEMLNDRTRLVAVMAVNNETGAIQPVSEAAAVLAEWNKGKSRPVHFHCDAVQAAGKSCIPPLDSWGPDSVSFSSHKQGGPRGTGVLWLKREMEMLYRGGGQESGMRPGTENLAGIAAMTDVFSRKYKPDSKSLTVGRRLLEGLQAISGCEILPAGRIGKPEFYTPLIISAACPPVPGEVMVRILGEAGYLVSTGSACASRKQKRTRILEAMGIPVVKAHTTIRISPTADLENGDADRFLSCLAKTYSDLKDQLS
jgi:cysteine desulfurase